MKTNIKQNIKVIILGLVIAIGAGYVSAWTGPTTSPTGNNVAAPINIGGGISGNIYSQYKTGLLTIDHLITPDLRIPTGTSLKGKVLQASNDSGDAAWVATSTLGLGNNSSGITQISVTATVVYDGVIDSHAVETCPEGKVVTGIGYYGGKTIVHCGTIEITVTNAQ